MLYYIKVIMLILNGFLLKNVLYIALVKCCISGLDILKVNYKDKISKGT